MTGQLAAGSEGVTSRGILEYRQVSCLQFSVNTDKHRPTPRVPVVLRVCVRPRRFTRGRCTASRASVVPTGRRESRGRKTGKLSHRHRTVPSDSKSSRLSENWMTGRLSEYRQVSVLGRNARQFFGSKCPIYRTECSPNFWQQIQQAL